MKDIDKTINQFKQEIDIVIEDINGAMLDFDSKIYRLLSVAVEDFTVIADYVQGLEARIKQLEQELKELKGE
jgi:polyhydroxyalkanoate synthesis regulator phasin